MRLASRFEFETPVLEEEKSISSIHYNDFLNVKLNESIFHIMVKTFFALSLSSFSPNGVFFLPRVASVL